MLTRFQALNIDAIDAGNGVYVLVSAAGKIDHDDLVLRHARCEFPGMGNGVTGLQRRNDAFHSGKATERLQSLCVCSSNIRGKLIPFSELPVFNPEWRPERPASSEVGLGAYANSQTSSIRDGLAYIDRIRPVTVKQGGQGRDKDVYRAACKLVECGMSQAEVGMHMERWNSTHVTPPLPRTELLHKINRAFMQAK